MKKIAIFASGRGTNMDNIIRCIKKGKIRGTHVALVFSDVEKAPALKKADRCGINTLYINPKGFKTKKKYEEAIVKMLKVHKVDYIILAGYMRILSPYIIKRYKNKILNIHPALLPAFKGAHGIRAAYTAGVKVTGVSVHFVTENLDGGPLILQEALSVKEGEPLASIEKRIHALEYQLYPKAINLLIQKKLTIKGNTVYRKK